MGKRPHISPFSVIVAFIALAMLGCAVLPLLPVKLAPSETLPAINVSFSMPGSSSRTVESEATGRLESALSRISGVRYVRSLSWTGGGNVTLEFDRNADIETARFMTAMIVRQLWNKLPDNAHYPHIAVRQVDDEATRPFMSYTVNASQRPAEIMQYAESYIRPLLSRISGVAKVELSGAMPMEWQLVYDNNLMAAMGISTSDIQSAIATCYGSEFLGLAPPYADDPGNSIRIALGNSAPQEPDLRAIVVKTKDGHIVTLDKIATATYAETAPASHFRINGLNSIYLNITAADNANQIDLGNKIKQCLADMPLPAGYMLNLSYDASERISGELDNIYFRTWITVLILLVFVGIITLSWRYLALITISLAINMAIAIVAYYLLKVEIQLYSLAGITISLNLVIDNLIVMTEHITRRHNLRAFSAVLAATLTTIGALSVVFFLDERTMLSLKDFVIVVIVNLSVSLLVALLLVPALVKQMGVRRRTSRRRRLPLRMMRAYGSVVRFLCRHKKAVYAVLILAFGLPVFMLPESVDGDNLWARTYNSTIGSEMYKEKIRPWVDCSLGGTLRLFAERVNNGQYWGRSSDEPVLYINATLPNGATLPQMNALMMKMESYLSTQDGLHQFQTSVYSGRRGSITVLFKPERQHTGYPYRLKSEIIAKALTLGGGSWTVYGLEDQGFSNDVRENAGSYRVKLRGYNYDELYARTCALRDTLLTQKRIREVTVNSRFTGWKDDYTEYYLSIDKEQLNKDGLSVADIYSAISRDFSRDITAATIPTTGGNEQIRLSSADRHRDVWGLMNVPLRIGTRTARLADYATIERTQAPPEIVKENQEYILCIQYEYIGSYTQGDKVLKNILDNFTASLPMGYHAERERYSWSPDDSSIQYLLLGLIAVIIFFISAILFNSLRQPLALIFVIPVSFIGVFLTFYLFDLKFDQGGFAAFVLLCGITVNAAIYIINEYNSLRTANPHTSATHLYLKAFRTKITAIILTVLSTVLGFIPFLIGNSQEGFWFPLAAGTMGGLIMSLVAITVLLPAIILRKPRPRASGKPYG